MPQTVEQLVVPGLANVEVHQLVGLTGMRGGAARCCEGCGSLRQQTFGDTYPSNLLD